MDALSIVVFATTTVPSFSVKLGGVQEQRGGCNLKNTVFQIDKNISSVPPLFLLFSIYVTQGKLLKPSNRFSSS